MTSEPLLRDVLDIPTHVTGSDYVLQLTTGVTQAEQTLADYVVTDALAASFDEALGLVGSTVAEHKSKGAFVHGSFGSGKSHFLAVLHLLLSGNAQARALPNLQAVVAKHQDLLGKSVLSVDYHLLGANSFEEALFSGYRDTIARLHPDAHAPVLHRSDDLIADARGIRKSMGDDAFFASLGGDASASGWGDLGTGWDAASFDAAAAMPYAPDNERHRLVQDLTATMFRGYTGSGDWLDITTGLDAMTSHAKSLGYDAIVLFLDELVLWLAQHLGDTTFIQSETSKVAKLVESGLGQLPLPLVSFVARQRDLADFLGGGAVGAEREALGQSFQWWEDRFERLQLKAADLPRIAHQRLLQPVDEAGAQAIDAAVARVESNQQAMRHLLSDEAQSGAIEFELVYPFSPALVDAMVALSSLLQRERTALKIMGELLSRGRDELRVGDVIPVGDLFDLVVEGQNPLTADMKQRFVFAGDFYGRLRTYLLGKHGLSEAEAMELPRDHLFRAEDRLAKTLLIAWLAPETVSLRNLTADKLAALNYGTVKSFIPGQDATTVTTWIRDWAKTFGEIRIGDGTNPTFGLELSGVDYDTIVERVRREDSPPKRRELIRDLVRELLGISTPAGLTGESTHKLVWRGAKRTVEIVFANIRDRAAVSDEVFRAGDVDWRVVIDYPFDDPTYSRADDFSRTEELRQTGEYDGTIAWVPYFLTSERMTDVGELVVLEYLLTGDRFDDNAAALPVDQRAPARQHLENKRRNLRTKVVNVIEQAYGVTTAQESDVERADQHPVFDPLDPEMRIAPPVAADLHKALDAVLDQAYTHRFPQHPAFEPSDSEIPRGELRTVWTTAQDTVAAGGRIDSLDKKLAVTMRRVCNPLRCGEARENVYALSPESFGWRQEFTQWVSSDGNADQSIAVGPLRRRLVGFGMSRDMEDLLILCWSLVADRKWTRASTSIEPPAIGQVTDDMRLVVPHLPDAEEWQRAGRRAEHLYGVQPDRALGVRSVARLAGAIRSAANETRGATAHLVRLLEEHASTLGLDTIQPGGRFDTAARASDLDDLLAGLADDTELVKALAGADVPEEPQAIAKSRTTAAGITAKIQTLDWRLLAKIEGANDPRLQTVREELAKAANANELHQPLLPALDLAYAGTRDVVIEPSPHPSPDPRPVPTPVDEVDAIELSIDDATGLDAVLGRLQSFYDDHAGRRIRVKWWAE